MRKESRIWGGSEGVYIVLGDRVDIGRHQSDSPQVQEQLSNSGFLR